MDGCRPPILEQYAGARRGVLNLPGVEEDVGLIGIHWRGRFIELVPWNGLVRCMSQAAGSCWLIRQNC